MERQSTNPWKIIGWIVLGLLLLSLIFCGGMCALVVGPSVQQGIERGQSKLDTPAALESRSPYSVRVVSVTCESRHANSAEVAIDNNGAEIPYAKAYVEFLDSNGKVIAAEDSYFRPSTIPRGSRASAHIYSRSTGAESCRLERIQDGDGNPVPLL
jgi:hypothetical protein